MHGGAAIEKNAARQLVHGGYAKTVPQDLKAAYEAALNDPDLLTLPKKIALCQAILSRQIEHYKGGDWKTAEALSNQIEQLSRLIERHHNIIHKQSNIATYDKVRVWLTQAAVATRMTLEEWVPEEDLEKAKAQLRSRIEAFGIDV